MTTLATTGAGYIGRHRAAQHRKTTGRRTIVAPVEPGYTPLAPATRQDLAPTHWQDRHLPAGADERTGLFDTAAILAAAATAPTPVDRTEVLAELRADLDATAVLTPIVTAPGDDAR